MMNLTVGELVQILQQAGLLFSAEGATSLTSFATATQVSRQVRGVEVDSRDVQAGDIFIALVGDRVDGHQYLPQVAQAGAVAALVTKPVAQPLLENLPKKDAEQSPESLPLLRVSDPVAALGSIAAAMRNKFTGCTVLGVTGSAGKTTTKDLLASIFETVGPTIAPPGSFNNEIGLPRTVLRATTETEYLVLEMGSRGLGHLRYLCEIAQPQISVVLNVGSAHMGEFGSVEAIAQAKGELVEWTTPGGAVVLNADDARVLAMAPRRPVDSSLWLISTQEHLPEREPEAAGHVWSSRVELDAASRVRFQLHINAAPPQPVQLQLVGQHQLANALAAAAAAAAAGVEPAQIAAALTQATTRSPWRMELVETASGVRVLNDAYNANPDSMAQALQTLQQLVAHSPAAGAHSWAILGEMRELGADATQQHAAVGELAYNLGVDRLIAVGQAARPISVAAQDLGADAREYFSVDSVEEAVATLVSQVNTGDVVLVKASRAAGLEQVAMGLMECAQQPGVDAP